MARTRSSIDFTLRQVERLQRNQLVFNRIMQMAIFTLAAVCGFIMRFSRRPAAMIALFQDDASTQANFPTNYFTGTA